jgi:hypothetical protein
MVDYDFCRPLFTVYRTGEAPLAVPNGPIAAFAVLYVTVSLRFRSD